MINTACVISWVAVGLLDLFHFGKVLPVHPITVQHLPSIRQVVVDTDTPLCKKKKYAKSVHSATYRSAHVYYRARLNHMTFEAAVFVHVEEADFIPLSITCGFSYLHRSSGVAVGRQLSGAWRSCKRHTYISCTQHDQRLTITHVLKKYIYIYIYQEQQ